MSKQTYLLRSVEMNDPGEKPLIFFTTGLDFFEAHFLFRFRRWEPTGALFVF
jgi:hypothetical protein